MRHLKNSGAGCLLSDFYIRFKDHLDWFQAQVNFYRDDFIEHQIAHPGVPGLVTNGKGHRITGLTGAGFADRDQDLINTLRAELKGTFSEVSTMDLFTFYEWICRNLQVLPEGRRGDVKSMIHRVGRESGDIQEVVQGLVEMFAGFLSFFSEAVTENPLKNAV